MQCPTCASGNVKRTAHIIDNDGDVHRYQCQRKDCKHRWSVRKPEEVTVVVDDSEGA